MYANNLKIITYRDNCSDFLDEFFVGWTPVKHSTEVSAVTITPVCETIPSSFELSGTIANGNK